MLWLPAVILFAQTKPVATEPLIGLRDSILQESESLLPKTVPSLLSRHYLVLGSAWGPNNVEMGRSYLMQALKLGEKPADVAGWMSAFDRSTAGRLAAGIEGETEGSVARALSDPEQAAAKLASREEKYSGMAEAAELVTKMMPFNPESVLRFARALPEEEGSYVLSSSAIELAKADPRLALKLIDQGGFSSHRDWAYSWIVQVSIEKDPEFALGLLRRIREAEWKVSALTAVAVALRDRQPHLAKRLADEAVSLIAALPAKDDALYGIVLRDIGPLSRFRPEGMESLLKRLRWDEESTLDTASISAAWARVDLEKALRGLAEHKHDRLMNTCFGAYAPPAYYEVVGAAIESDPKIAAKVVLDNGDLERFDTFPAELVTYVDPSRLANLKQFGILVESSKLTAEADRAERTRLALLNLNRAPDILRGIPSGKEGGREETAVNAAYLCPRDVPLTLQILGTIEDVEARVNAISEVAFIRSATNPDEGVALFREARKLLESTSEVRRGYLLAKLADKIGRAATTHN